MHSKCLHLAWEMSKTGLHQKFNLFTHLYFSLLAASFMSFTILASHSHVIIRQLKHQKKLLKVKFIHSEKATKFCKIFTLLLSYVVPVKSKVKILQNFVAFSEYMNFIFRDTLFTQTRYFSSFFVSPVF